MPLVSLGTKTQPWRAMHPIWSVAPLIAVVMSLVAVPVASAQTPPAQPDLTMNVNPDAVTVSAEAAILVDLTDRRILYAREMHRRQAIASLTKVMTAVVAFRYGTLSDEAVVTEDDLPGEASIGLEAGDRVRLEHLLWGMLMRSGNDAATVVGRLVGEKVKAERGIDGDGIRLFVELMNQQAASFGMSNTQYVNPHGLDEAGHFSTAYDLALLTAQALGNPTFTAMFSSREHTFPGGEWSNTNRLLYQYEGLLGGKTGITDDAGLCLIEVAERDGHRLLVVVLNAPEWYNDARVLLDWGFGPGKGLARDSLPPFGAPSPATGPLKLPAVAPISAQPSPTAAATAQPTVAVTSTPLATATATLTAAAGTTPTTQRPVYGSGEEIGWQEGAVSMQQGGGGDITALLPLVLGIVALIIILLVVRWLRSAGIGPGARSAWPQREANSAPAWHTYDVARDAGRDQEPEDQIDAGDELDSEPVARGDALQRTGELHMASDDDEDAEDDAEPAPAEAESTRERAEPQRDEIAEAHVAVAVRYIQEDRLEAAESAFVKAIQMAPDYRFTRVPHFWTMGPEGYLALAQAYLRCSRSSDARAVVTLGLVVCKEHPALLAFEEHLQRERRREARVP